ncbi:NUDIX hydrolase [Brevibacterium otitidis]|uniref:NUDIX hydrolase n=1 Tax=Brevibacterium otitidis TaxID=53364 RepID=A0ABV5WZT5_9MICO|nr:CoA pyrophosphatase [Brevibacterium otitidis]
MSLWVPGPGDPARTALERLAASGGNEKWLRRGQKKDDKPVRDASVLMLFGRGQQPRTPGGQREHERLSRLGVADVDVLLLQRSANLRHHPNQVAFPGGGRDPEDADEIAAALREAEEETGLDPDGVEIVGTLDPLYIPVSSFEVTPVVAWWQHPTNVWAVDRGESASVYRVPVADLVAPENRGTFAAPDRSYVTPAFDVGVLRVWGFTAALLEFALDEMGWARDWDRAARIDIEL